jgi:hypothetical protein
MPLTVFARQKADLSRELTDKIGHLMKGVAADPFLLYEVVAGGQMHFRNTFLREFAGYPVDGNLADLVFGFFCQQVVKRHPGGETAERTAADYLDAAEVKSPPTAEEIERSWVHEVFSSEDGRRTNYIDGAGMAGQDHKVIVKN